MATPAASLSTRAWVLRSGDAAVRVGIWSVALDLLIPKVPETCPNIGPAKTDVPVLTWTGQLTILYNITVFQDAHSSQKN